MGFEPSFCLVLLSVYNLDCDNLGIKTILFAVFWHSYIMEAHMTIHSENNTTVKCNHYAVCSLLTCFKINSSSKIKLIVSCDILCSHTFIQISSWLSVWKIFFKSSVLATSPLDTFVNTVCVCNTSSISVSLK